MIATGSLPRAEEEITEASLFDEAASAGLGEEFLDDMQRVVGILREQPELGRLVGHALRLARL